MAIKSWRPGNGTYAALCAIAIISELLIIKYVPTIATSPVLGPLAGGLLLICPGLLVYNLLEKFMGPSDELRKQTAPPRGWTY